jgi:tRNA A-37 threonylcarbamoyl transferase component Bud32
LHLCGVVHADLKSENIILYFDHEKQTIRSMKVIDMGSAFLLNKNGIRINEQIEFGQSTPEYLPPEI